LQVDRWARQYVATTADGNPGKDPKVLELIEWLKANVPAEDALTVRTGIVHGDFRLDNLIFHPTEVKVKGIGVLDINKFHLLNKLESIILDGFYTQCIRTFIYMI
jgi:acyl-CoA dehydrogenase